MASWALGALGKVTVKEIDFLPVVWYISKSFRVRARMRVFAECGWRARALARNKAFGCAAMSAVNADENDSDGLQERLVR